MLNLPPCASAHACPRSCLSALRLDSSSPAEPSGDPGVLSTLLYISLYRLALAVILRRLCYPQCLVCDRQFTRIVKISKGRIHQEPTPHLPPRPYSNPDWGGGVNKHYLISLPPRFSFFLESVCGFVLFLFLFFNCRY